MERGDFRSERIMVAAAPSPTAIANRNEKPLRQDTRQEPVRLYGTEVAEGFLRRHLLGPNRQFAEVPNQKTLLLFGRKGAGKATLVQKIKHDKREFFSGFSETHAWKLRPWDDIERFVAFVTSMIGRARDIHDTYPSSDITIGGTEKDEEREPNRMLIIIWNVHLLATSRDQTCMFQVVRLLSAIKNQAKSVEAHGGNGAVRVLMTCDVPPSQLPQELRMHIDAEQYVGNMQAHDRRAFLLDHMRRFHKTATTHPHFKNLSWSVSLDDESIQENPEHIVNQLTVASHGCTPWEMQCFIERVNMACAEPLEDGSTVYSDDLILSMMRQTTGIGRTLTDHNPVTLNMPFSRHLGISFTTLSDFNDAFGGGGVKRGPLPGETALDQPIVGQAAAKEEKSKEVVEIERRLFPDTSNDHGPVGQEPPVRKRTMEDRAVEMGVALEQLAVQAELDATREMRKRQREGR